MGAEPQEFRLRVILNPIRLPRLLVSLGVMIRGTLGDVDPLNKAPVKRAIK